MPHKYFSNDIQGQGGGEYSIRRPPTAAAAAAAAAVSGPAECCATPISDRLGSSDTTAGRLPQAALHLCWGVIMIHHCQLSPKEGDGAEWEVERDNST